MIPEEWERLARKERLLRCQFEDALRKIRAEAHHREEVLPGQTIEAQRSTAFTLSGRLGQIERISSAALSRVEAPSQTDRVEGEIDG